MCSVIADMHSILYTINKNSAATVASTTAAIAVTSDAAVVPTGAATSKHCRNSEPIKIVCYDVTACGSRSKPTELDGSSQQRTLLSLLSQQTVINTR
jgi:hypothetical protein